MYQNYTLRSRVNDRNNFEVRGGGRFDSYALTKMKSLQQRMTLQDSPTFASVSTTFVTDWSLNNEALHTIFFVMFRVVWILMIISFIKQPPLLSNHVLLQELILDDNSISTLEPLADVWLPSLQVLSVKQNRWKQLRNLPLLNCWWTSVRNCIFLNLGCFERCKLGFNSKT